MSIPDPRKGFEALTYLYIRTNPSDDGTEPLAAGLPGWISPDINIISNAAPAPAPDSGIAVAHQVNTIEVIVTNAGGVAANNAFVECFECSPSTGFSPASSTFIGSGFLTIPGTQTNRLQLNWTPQHSGHICLLARVGLMFPPDVFRDPSIFDVYGDRHVAQRNVHVDEVRGPSQQFTFLVVNPFAEARGFTLGVQDVTLQKDRLPAYAFLQKKGLAAAPQGVKSAGLLMVPAPVAAAPGLVAPRAEAATRLEAKVVGDAKAVAPAVAPTAAVPVAPMATQPLSVQMKPREVLHCTLTIANNPGLAKGQCNILEISQYDARTKRAVGGLTVIIAKRS